MVATDYLEVNQDLLDILMSRCDNMDIAIHYSTIPRDCIRHQVAAQYNYDLQRSIIKKSNAPMDVFLSNSN